MNRDVGFLRAILSEPEDDGVRLIYADWLEDHDQPARAEFIRLQLDLAHLPEDSPRRASLEEREGELLTEHGVAWLAPLEDILPEVDTAPVFHRGFVSEVIFYGKTGAQRFVDHAEELFRRAPVVQVRLFPMGGHEAPLFPWERVKLDVSRLDPADLEALCELPELDHLQLLDFSGNTQESPGGGPLSVVSNLIGDTGACLLAECPYLRHLETLLLRDNTIGDEGARALVDSPHLTRLNVLDLGFNRLSEQVTDELRSRFAGRVLFE
jgi:uncharacterized protein (TIGR02996 family)